MKADQVILTRQLPKTGQVISYQSGDDGDIEAGWWKGRLNANNKTRFIAKTIAGNDVVIDRATGLMWAADGNEAGCYSGNVANWSTAIAGASGLNFAGFTDWRIPNILELLSIVDYSKNSPSIYTDFFKNTVSGEYWTSTTYEPASTQKWFVDFDTGYTYYAAKTGTKYLRCVRGGL